MANPNFFQFTVLPFGLLTACYAFTKLLRPLVKYLCSQGLRALLYLDDGIIAVEGKEAALRASHKVRADRGWLSTLPNAHGNHRQKLNGWALG